MVSHKSQITTGEPEFKVISLIPESILCPDWEAASLFKVNGLTTVSAPDMLQSCRARTNLPATPLEIFLHLATSPSFRTLGDQLLTLENSCCKILIPPSSLHSYQERFFYMSINSKWALSLAHLLITPTIRKCV